MPASPAKTPLTELSTALAGLVARTAPSIVSLGSRRAKSSGFVWRPGLIVTAEEALAEDDSLTVGLAGGETVAATLVGRDPSTDIALLRFAGAELRPVSLAAAPVAAGALANVV
ncbi:MAG: serine protease, partial [Bauldia sp.]